MTFDGNHIQIPNATVYKSTLVNYSANPNRRVDFEVGIGYDDSAAEAQEVILKELAAHPAILDDPEPRVVLNALGAATVNLRVYFWLNATSHNWETVRSSAMRIVKQSLLDANISLPDEAREVVFPSGVPVKMLESQSPHGDQSNSENGCPAPTKPSKRHVREELISAAEGSLKNESDELKRQAEQSWEPEGGTNLLANGD